MCDGNERKRKKKPYFLVNKKGFISMYALLILTVFLAFATMFAQTVHTFTNTHKKEITEFIDIYILKQVQMELTNRQNKEDENHDLVQQQIEMTNEYPQEDIITDVYNGCAIQYRYEGTQILVHYVCEGKAHDICIDYDPKKNSILKYAYP